MVGLGVMRVFDAYPTSYGVMKVLSVGYLLYLAWKIATAAGPGERVEVTGKPFSFLQAALFQWVNPKGWAVCVTAFTVYAPATDTQTALLVCFVFFVVTVPAVSVWTLLGQQLRKLLTNQLRLRAFNTVMATLLVASLYPVLF
jgi:threonine/homoserine/homoserine lactone efflux protein